MTRRRQSTKLPQPSVNPQNIALVGGIDVLCVEDPSAEEGVLLQHLAEASSQIGIQDSSVEF